jgi:hypothetical protein
MASNAFPVGYQLLEQRGLGTLCALLWAGPA